MPANEHVLTLMAWHPSADAGVRIPFRVGVRPLARRIVTPLVRRLQGHAQAIAAGEQVPRIIVLVGGSGNGKTDAVEAYVEALDIACGADGKLLDRATSEFFAEGLLPAWLVSFPASEIAGNASALANIGNISILQDASASQEPGGDAAARLAQVLASAISSNEKSLMLACVNRGLLNRVLKHAVHSPEMAQVVELISRVALACSEVVEHGALPDCWPLSVAVGSGLERRAAVWPLDLESLLVSDGSDASVFDQVFDVATDPGKWGETSCEVCPGKSLCPFRSNASELQTGNARTSLLTLLRDFEIATGARWTFRQLFGLAAELLVGHPSTFGEQHPCEWAQSHAESVVKFSGSASDPSLLALVSRLYPNVLFPISDQERAAALAIATAADAARGEPLTEQVVAMARLIARAVAPRATHLQQKISDSLSPRFDPADRELVWLAEKVSSELEAVFEACDVTVATGLAVAIELTNPPQIERNWIQRLADCDQDINIMQRSSTLPREALAFVRALAAASLARGIGARLAAYPLRGAITGYEQSARNVGGLRRLASQEFPKLIAPPEGKLKFGLLETLENIPLAEERAFNLISSTALTALPSTVTNSGARPKSELPAIRLEGVRTVPMTFDLYLALRERGSKREANSEPAAVRAAIGQLRVLVAGKLGRSIHGFESYQQWYEVGPDWEIHLDEAHEPTLTQRDQL